MSVTVDSVRWEKSRRRTLVSLLLGCVGGALDRFGGGVEGALGGVRGRVGEVPVEGQ